MCWVSIEIVVRCEYFFLLSFYTTQHHTIGSKRSFTFSSPAKKMTTIVTTAPSPNPVFRP